MPNPIRQPLPKGFRDNREERREKRETPQPPQAGGPKKVGGASLSEARAERARNGSNRKRDVEALNYSSKIFPPDDVQPNAEAAQAWTDALDCMSEDHPAYIAANMRYLVCRGVSGGKVVIVGERNVSFFRRRHQETLSEHVREVSDFDGVLICDEVQT